MNGKEFLGKFKSSFLWANLLAMALVIVLCVMGVKYGLDTYTHHGEEVSIPDVRRRTFDDAECILNSLGFNVVVIPVKGNIRKMELLASWKPEIEYSLEIDSAAFRDIYGLVSKPLKRGIKVRSLDEFSTLVVNLSGIQDTGIVVQLVNSSDVVVKQVRAKGHTAEFYYVMPNTYYLRAFIDANGNNEWDTGNYDEGRPAEAVYYYSQEKECKAKWDLTIDWNLTARRRFEQKPQALVKQKGEQGKKLQNRNAQRAKQLGKEYLKGKGVNL